MNDSRPNDENLRFWRCCVGTNGVLNLRFNKKTDAMEKARALALEYSDQPAYVLEAVQGYRTPKPKIEMFVMSDAVE